jgi:glutathione S-transferase
MTKIILYYAPVTCALAPYVTLTEAKAEFETRPVNFRKGQNKTPDFLKMNPEHKVPVLVVDGKPLTQNVAIHQWVARTYPQAKILPTDPWQELQAISLHGWCASGIHPYLTRLNNPAKVCDAPGSEDSVKKFATENLFENFQMAEELLAGREWFFDHFTSVDAHFFWCFRRATLFNLDLTRFKNSMAHFERMKGRPSVQKVLAYEKEVQAQFAKAA